MCDRICYEVEGQVKDDKLNVSKEQRTEKREIKGLT